jgi:hypothetical protein
VGLKSLKSLNLTNGYPNKNKKKNNNNNNNNNKVKSKPLELFELAGKKTENLFSPYPRSKSDINWYTRLKIAMSCYLQGKACNKLPAYGRKESLQSCRSTAGY